MNYPMGAAKVRFEYLTESSQRGQHSESILTDCAKIVTEAALDPSSVFLVVTGDFVKSVRDRLPAEIAHHYTTDRGDGSVGAKVMAVGEEFHVVTPELYFEPNENPSFDYALRNQVVAQMMRHEAGHVTMEQAGEASGPTIDRDGAARRRLLHIADEVISEYRAELGVALVHRTALDGFRPAEIASWLRATLAEITTVSYQAHLDPERLAYDVSAALQIAAKQLAPRAAERQLRAVSPDEPFESATEQDADWQVMLKPVWPRFATSLAAVPPASERFLRADLDRTTADMADILNELLVQLSFDWNDAANSFRITSFHLYV